MYLILLFDSLLHLPSVFGPRNALQDGCARLAESYLLIPSFSPDHRDFLEASDYSTRS